MLLALLYHKAKRFVNYIFLKSGYFFSQAEKCSKTFHPKDRHASICFSAGRASLQIMSLLRRPRGQDPSSCLRLAGAASSKARQLRKQGQHQDTPSNPDDYSPSPGAAARLCRPGFDPVFSCCLAKNFLRTARYDRLRDPAPSATSDILRLRTGHEDWFHGPLILAYYHAA